VTEENNKGVALVILGIVSIIAIVGLVLLFTGARKATGEFSVGIARTGAAIGNEATASYARQTADGDYSAGLGLDGTERTVRPDTYSTYGRAISQIPSIQTSNCQGLVSIGGVFAEYTESASEQKKEVLMAQGADCIPQNEIPAILEAVEQGGLGRTSNAMSAYDSTGVGYCCTNPPYTWS